MSVLSNLQLQDFNHLYEILIELYGLKYVFFFDEIQNIEDWELFVRRIHREKNKVFITGSNASLLSSELSTRLTGRHIVIELLPFSFREYLQYHRIIYNEKSFLITQEKAILKRSFNEFLENGGMPEYLEHKNPLVLQNVYENILYKDVIVRDDPNRFHDRFEFSNPGSLLISFDQILRGGISECRNKSLQQMFTFIGAAERAGSGIDKIWSGVIVNLISNTTTKNGLKVIQE